MIIIINKKHVARHCQPIYTNEDGNMFFSFINYYSDSRVVVGNTFCYNGQDIHVLRKSTSSAKEFIIKDKHIKRIITKREFKKIFNKYLLRQIKRISKPMDKLNNLIDEVNDDSCAT